MDADVQKTVTGCGLCKQGFNEMRSVSQITNGLFHENPLIR